MNAREREVGRCVYGIVALYRQQILQQSDMLLVAEQLAAGMEYLSSQWIVHGDVAARNVLVGAAAHVKISDLGLGRHTYPHEYYAPPPRLNTAPPLPVRWLPPESIATGVVTTDSDVWSLAVTLWEVGYAAVTTTIRLRFDARSTAYGSTVM